MDNLTPDTTLALLGANNAKSTHALETLKDNQKAKDLKRLEEAAEDFEAVFMAEMLKPMFETLKVNATFGGGKGEEVFRSFLVQEYGKILAGTGKTGISQQVKAALLDIQEHADGTAFALNNTTQKNED